MFTTQLKSQNLNWDKSYAHNNYESHGYSIQPITTGGYIVCGSAITDGNGKDIYLLKTNEDGDTLWTKVIGGTNDDEGYCVHQCLDGGFIIAGYTASYGNGGFDFFLVKTNSAGAVQWTRTNGGTLNEGSYNIIQTNDSGFLAVGYTYSTGGGGSDVRAVKYTKYGVVQWSKTYGNAYNQIGYSVCQMRDSSFVICGSTARGISDSLDVYVIKTNLNGDTLWTHTYKHEGYDCAYAVQPCNETGFVIAGKTNLKEGAHTDMLFMKIFDDGTPIFTQTYGVTGYDEVAFDVKETETNGFLLVGTTNANSQGIDGYVVHTDDHGDLLEETYYGAEDDDDFRSVCIKNDKEFAVTGTITNTVSIAEYANCLVALPRTLWYQSSWQYGSGKTNAKKRQTLFLTDDIFSYTEKTAQFVAYCKGAKIHTVVLGRLEDIIRQGNKDTSLTYSNYPSCDSTNGDTLRMRLFNLVDSLHTVGKVSVVLAHWRDENKETNDKYADMCPGWQYHYDEDTIGIKHNLEILAGFKKLNNAQPKVKRLDGIMLDYEYFTPLYGKADNTHNYKDALPGFVQWKILADSIVAARGKNGINFIQAYLARVVFTAKGVIDSNYFNYDGLTNTAGDSTSIEDSKAELWHIDSLGFNKLSLAFFVDDRMQDSTKGPNPIPTTFLSGFAYPGGGLAAGGAQSEEQRYRWRVQILGNDPGGIKTRFEPVFMSRNSPDTLGGLNCNSSISPILGNLLLGGCFWATHGWPDTTLTPGTVHYLSEIEEALFEQYDQEIGVDHVLPWVDPDGLYTFSYGNCGLQGIQWYQYSTYNDAINPTNNYIVPLSYASLAGRGGDSIIFTAYCGQFNRVVNPSTTIESVVKSKNTIDNKSVMIFPNPMNKTGGQIIIKGFEDVTFEFHDAFGNDVTNKISLQLTSSNNYHFIPSELNNGVYMITVTDKNQTKHVKSFSVVK